MKAIHFLLACMAITGTAISQTTADCGCTHPFPFKVASPGISKQLQDQPPVADNVVTDAYNHWKCGYLKAGQLPDELIVKNDEKGSQKDNITTSEAISYGMIIEALMAGYDHDARSKFDRLYNYALHHSSKKNKFLMAWTQNKHFQTEDKNDDSAVDGDLDIAYALLLAYKQWGEDHYRSAADSTLAAIVAQEIDSTGARIVRGNASVPSDGYPYHVIRMSDFMPAELHTFAQLTNWPIWDALVEKNYARYERAQEMFSPAYGLFPDYIHVDDNDTLSLLPNSISKKTREGEGFNDGGRDRLDNPLGRFYGLNSCRVPWRIATDYLLNGNGHAKGLLDRINTGIRKYTLDSRCLLALVMMPDDNKSPEEHSKRVKTDADDHSADLCIVGPLCIAAMTDPVQTEWRRQLQGLLTEDKAFLCENNNKPNKPDYYSSTIRMICLLLLSNHYWAPEN